MEVGRRIDNEITILDQKKKLALNLPWLHFEEADIEKANQQSKRLAL